MTQQKWTIQIWSEVKHKGKTFLGWMPGPEVQTKDEAERIATFASQAEQSPTRIRETVLQ